jgi:hypothetical protein
VRYVAVAALFAAVAGSVGTAAQSPGAAAFDVVSIKRDTSGSRAVLFGTVKGATFSVEGATAATLIRYAYPAEDRRIDGLPAWANSDRYVVVANATGAVTRQELTSMLVAMLADRFKVTMHYETREGRVYALVVAHPSGKPKPTLRQTALDCAAIGKANERGESVPGNGERCASVWNAPERGSDGCWGHRHVYLRGPHFTSGWSPRIRPYQPGGQLRVHAAVFSGPAATGRWSG